MHLHGLFLNVDQNIIQYFEPDFILFLHDGDHPLQEIRISLDVAPIYAQDGCAVDGVVG